MKDALIHFGIIVLAIIAMLLIIFVADSLSFDDYDARLTQIPFTLGD